MAPPIPRDAAKFTFTKRQNDFLKPNLVDYMQALYGEDSDLKCKEFIDKMYAALKKEYDLHDSRKDAIILVRILYLYLLQSLLHIYFQALNELFSYKAKRAAKKGRVPQPLRVTARDEFHWDNWLSIIRPSVIKVLGTDDAKNKYWLSTIKRVEAVMWECLDDTQQKEYQRRADEKNEGRAATKVTVE